MTLIHMPDMATADTHEVGSSLEIDFEKATCPSLVFSTPAEEDEELNESLVEGEEVRFLKNLSPSELEQIVDYWHFWALLEQEQQRRLFASSIYDRLGKMGHVFHVTAYTKSGLPGDRVPNSDVISAAKELQTDPEGFRRGLSNLFDDWAISYLGTESGTRTTSGNYTPLNGGLSVEEVIKPITTKGVEREGCVGFIPHTSWRSILAFHNSLVWIINTAYRSDTKDLLCRFRSEESTYEGYHEATISAVKKLYEHMVLRGIDLYLLIQKYEGFTKLSRSISEHIYNPEMGRSTDLYSDLVKLADDLKESILETSRALKFKPGIIPSSIGSGSSKCFKDGMVSKQDIRFFIDSATSFTTTSTGLKVDAFVATRTLHRSFNRYDLFLNSPVLAWSDAKIEETTWACIGFLPQEGIVLSHNITNRDKVSFDFGRIAAFHSPCQKTLFGDGIPIHAWGVNSKLIKWGESSSTMHPFILVDHNAHTYFSRSRVGSICLGDAKEWVTACWSDLKDFLGAFDVVFEVITQYSRGNPYAVIQNWMTPSKIDLLVDGCSKEKVACDSCGDLVKKSDLLLSLVDSLWYCPRCRVVDDVDGDCIHRDDALQDIWSGRHIHVDTDPEHYYLLVDGSFAAKGRMLNKVEVRELYNGEIYPCCRYHSVSARVLPSSKRFEAGADKRILATDPLLRVIRRRLIRCEDRSNIYKPKVMYGELHHPLAPDDFFIVDDEDMYPSMRIRGLEQVYHPRGYEVEKANHHAWVPIRDFPKESGRSNHDNLHLTSGEIVRGLHNLDCIRPLNYLNPHRVSAILYDQNWRVKENPS